MYITNSMRLANPKKTQPAQESDLFHSVIIFTRYPSKSASMIPKWVHMLNPYIIAAIELMK